MLRSVGHQLRTDDPELALDLWADVQSVVKQVKGDPRQLVRLGQAFVKRNRFEEALVTLQMALDAGGGGLDPNLALVIARATREWGRSTARAAAQQAVDHPAADAETRAQAQKMLAALESAPVELDIDLDPELEDAPAAGEEPSGEQFGGKSSIPLSS
jgi:hypothetical protein